MRRHFWKENMEQTFHRLEMSGLRSGYCNNQCLETWKQTIHSFFHLFFFLRKNSFTKAHSWTFLCTFVAICSHFSGYWDFRLRSSNEEGKAFCLSGSESGMHESSVFFKLQAAWTFFCLLRQLRYHSLMEALFTWCVGEGLDICWSIWKGTPFCLWLPSQSPVQHYQLRKETRASCVCA